MSLTVSVWILFILFIGAAVINVPIAYALCFAGSVFVYMTNLVNQEMLIQTIFATTDNFPLLAVPFFIIAGELMSTGGIAKRLVDLAKTLVGRFTGGLGAIAILACMVFAAISGSGTATAAAIGGILISIMIDNKYNKDHAPAIVATAGALGPIIPPSIFFVLYGVIASVSIGKLFLAGVIPGLLIVLFLLIANYIICKRERYPILDQKYTLKEKLIAVKDAFWALMAPVVVLGGIYGGFFTPTEAAVASVVYSVIVSVFVYRQISFRDLPDIFIRGGLTASTILIILGPAAFFGKLLAVARVPQMLGDWLVHISSNPMIFIIVVNILLLISGMLIEGTAALTILSPLLVPIARIYDIDLVYFGVLICVNLSIGLFTPPFGLNLFITSRIAQTDFMKTLRYLWPQLITALAALAIIIAIPQLSTWLPSLLK